MTHIKAGCSQLRRCQSPRPALRHTTPKGYDSGMRQLTRLLLMILLAALANKGLAPVGHAMAQVATIEHAHCMEHTTPDTQTTGTPLGGSDCGKCGDCCLGAALPSMSAPYSAPQRLSLTLTPRRIHAPPFITSAPERPPRLHLA